MAAKRPRCGRTWPAVYRNGRAAFPCEVSACGRPEGHRGHCLSAEVWERDKRARAYRAYGPRKAAQD